MNYIFNRKKLDYAFNEKIKLINLIYDVVYRMSLSNNFSGGSK